MRIRLALAGAAAAIVAAALVYSMTRTPRAASPVRPVVEPSAVELAGGELAQADRATAVADPAQAPRRSSVSEKPSAGTTPASANVLRVVLEGVTEEDARKATVTVTGVDERDGRPVELGGPWPSQGRTSELDLDPVLAGAARRADLREGELEVAVDHPHHLAARTRFSLPDGGEPTDGRTVHEVRVRLSRSEPWPELALAVRDAHTRAHLTGIELRVSEPGTAFWGRNGTSTRLGDGLRSPIGLMGVRAADEAEHRVAGIALSPAAGESPRLVALVRRSPPERGVIVSARAPGHAWGSISLDVSQGDRELLLEPAAGLGVRLTNVRLERYAALGTLPMLCVYRIREDGGNQHVRFERLDETLATEGLRLESLVPGGYRVAVELGGGSWTEQPVLARAELSGEHALAAGETRDLVLALADPPAPPERATLGGVLSFPAFGGPHLGGAETIRLQLYFQPTQRWRDPDVELSTADMQRVGGALPTWSFRVEDLPVGPYRVQLLPFLEVWLIDLPAGGREDLELVLPEVAEALVETVDAETGERVPLDELYYRNEELLPGQAQNDFARAVTEEPGRFRFWTGPGEVMVWPRFPTGADRDPGSGKVLDLLPGPQSVRLELEPVYAIRFEFREGGTVLPTGPQGMQVLRDVRAVGHEGRVTRDGLQSTMLVGVSAPGLYEIRFDGISAEDYHPIPPRLVDVRAGAVTEAIVELRRK